MNQNPGNKQLPNKKPQKNTPRQNNPRQNKSLNKKLVLLGLVALVFIVLALSVSGNLDLQYFDLQVLKTKQATIDAYFHSNPILTAAVYFVVYVAVTALSLPGATVMTLAGGAVFGLLWGTLLVSFASTIGATLAFLVSRFLLRDIIQQRFGDKLKAVNAGVEKDGGFYLFTLRLVPAFPFFIINLVMGLTPLATRTFYWVSQLGMLAGTLVYVNAGTQLARIESLNDILSPALIASFTLLGIFPIITRKIVEGIKARRV